MRLNGLAHGTMGPLSTLARGGGFHCLHSTQIGWRVRADPLSMPAVEALLQVNKEPVG